LAAVLSRLRLDWARTWLRAKRSQPRHRGIGTVRVAGPSMVPTLRPGDHCLVRWGVPARAGDLVIAQHPGRPGLLLVKRAVQRRPDGWWLRSDNRYAGGDSTDFGAIPETLVRGRVVLRYWPLLGRR
jgi:nickel-type superoxide dismutase maturation protease